MTADDVIRTLDGLAGAGVECWVDGGWGVDALLGRQTRDHSDLDLVVAVEHVDHARAWLTDAGYTVIRDWLPTAIAFARPDGAEVDLHPVDRTPDGGGDQRQLDGVTTYHYRPPTLGRIGGSAVRCCPVEDQVSCHLGYPPTGKDWHDMRLLADERGAPLRPPYGDAAAGDAPGRQRP